MYLCMEFFVGAKKHNSSVINYPQDVLRNIGAIENNRFQVRVVFDVVEKTMAIGDPADRGSGSCS